MSVAIVTGASSGIGKQFAEALTHGHYGIDEIWVVARRRALLQELARAHPETKFVIIDGDLTEQETLDKLRSSLEERRPRVSVLVNNAGAGTRGSFTSTDLDAQLNTCRLNVVAATAIAHLVLPHITPGGFVLDTCSLESYLPSQNMAVYAASKAYLLTLSLSLRAELRKRRINVLALCPGRMRTTEFDKRAGIDDAHGSASARMPDLDPAVVARRSLALAARGRAVYVPGLLYAAIRGIARLAPLSAVARVAVL